MQACDSEGHPSDPCRTLVQKPLQMKFMGPLTGTQGSMPLSEGNAMLRLAAVVPTSGCNRDSELREEAWGHSGFLAVLGAA